MEQKHVLEEGLNQRGLRGFQTDDNRIIFRFYLLRGGTPYLREISGRVIKRNYSQRLNSWRRRVLEKGSSTSTSTSTTPVSIIVTHTPEEE